RAAAIAEAGLTLVNRSRLKAALDIERDDPAAPAAALQPLPRQTRATWRSALTQDLEPDPTTGGQRIVRGVAKGRQPSLGDREMRHGRKSRTRPFTGDQRHVVKPLEPDLIVEAVARPANEPEHTILATLTTHVAPPGALSA